MGCWPPSPRPRLVCALSCRERTGRLGAGEADPQPWVQISEGPRCGPTWVPARGEITGLYSLPTKPFPDLLAAPLEARDVILVPGEDEGYTDPENWGWSGGGRWPWSLPSRPPRAGPGAWAPPPNPLPSSVPRRGTWPWGWGDLQVCTPRPALELGSGAAVRREGQTGVRDRQGSGVWWNGVRPGRLPPAA